MGDKGTAAVAKALRERMWSSLEELNLSSCELRCEPPPTPECACAFDDVAFQLLHTRKWLLTENKS